MEMQRSMLMQYRTQVSVKIFWDNIFSVQQSQNENTGWLNDIKNMIKLTWQERMTITEEMVRKQSKKIPGWKTSRRGGVYLDASKLHLINNVNTIFVSLIFFDK